jgi:hypothetical protein
MARTVVTHPVYGEMWTVPRAAAYLQISRSEMLRRMAAPGEGYEVVQERPGAWHYVSVRSVEQAWQRRWAPTDPDVTG